jgi:hypothetical protein
MHTISDLVGGSTLRRYCGDAIKPHCTTYRLLLGLIFGSRSDICLGSSCGIELSPNPAPRCPNTLWSASRAQTPVQTLPPHYTNRPTRLRTSTLPVDTLRSQITQLANQYRSSHKKKKTCSPNGRSCRDNQGRSYSAWMAKGVWFSSGVCLLLI